MFILSNETVLITAGFIYEISAAVRVIYVLETIRNVLGKRLGRVRDESKKKKKKVSYYLSILKLVTQ